jgi:hypothetical protein
MEQKRFKKKKEIPVSVFLVTHKMIHMKTMHMKKTTMKKMHIKLMRMKGSQV